MDLSIDESIEYDDWLHYFEKLNKRVNEISVYFPITTEILRGYCEHKIKSLRTLKLWTSYLLSEDKFAEALENIYKVSLEVNKFSLETSIYFIIASKCPLSHILSTQLHSKGKTHNTKHCLCNERNLHQSCSL